MDSVENVIKDMVKSNADDNECCEEEYYMIPLDCSEQAEEHLDKDRFKKGLDDFSYASGAITALCNAGLKPSEALEYIINIDTINHNLEVSRISAEATVESAKYASIKGDMETI